METKSPEESEVVSEPLIKTEKPSNSNALIKLVILVVLGFAVIKYGVPLMNQISKKSTEVLDKGDTEKVKPSEDKTPVELVPATPSIRITKGYEAWEPEVRDKLAEWVDEEVKYKLLSVEFNEAKELMEIRYSKLDNEGFTSKQKLLLSKDGFGERYIYSSGDKEILIYPPE